MQLIFNSFLAYLWNQIWTIHKLNKKQIRLKSSETRWVQTSDSFRGTLAGKDWTFDSEKNIFLPKKQFASWVLNSEGNDWEAPVASPSIIEDTSIVLGQRNVETDADHPVGSNVYSRYFPYWNEENLRWHSINSKGILHYWNPDNSTWNII